MNPVQKIALVSSAPLTVTRAPAALAFMAGICEHHNIDYEIFDLNIDFLKTHDSEIYAEIFETVAIVFYDDAHQVSEEHKRIIEAHSLEVCKKIQAGGFDALAISVLSYQQSFWTVSFLKTLKQKLPHINVIVGGPGVGTTNKVDFTRSSYGRYLLENRLADGVVQGEGDILFGEFLLGTAEGKSGFNVKGSEDTWQPQIDDLDITPLPSYKKIKFSDYNFAGSKPEVTITASKGCVRDCTFCDIGYFWKKFRYRSGPRVAEEMYKSYREMGITDFWFNDSLMNGSFKQFFEFMESLKKLQDQDPGFAQIKYGGQLILRPKNTHTEKMYELLGQTGGKFFQVGIESGSESVRDHMRKKFSNEDVYYHYEMSEKFKIQNWIFMTVAYPTETNKDFQDTLDMFTHLQKYLINDTVVGTSFAGPLLILENTPLAGMMDELNIHYASDEATPGQWSSHAPGGLTTQTKFLRYVQLTKHVLDLGYRVNSDLSPRLSQQLKVYTSKTDEFKKVKTKKIIPIVPISSSILS